MSILFAGLSLQHKQTYYVTVVAANKVDLAVQASSSPIVVDDTPPKVIRDLYAHYLLSYLWCYIIEYSLH